MVPTEATVEKDVHFPDRDDSPVFGTLVLHARARLRLLGLLRQRRCKVLTGKRVHEGRRSERSSFPLLARGD